MAVSEAGARGFQSTTPVSLMSRFVRVVFVIVSQMCLRNALMEERKIGEQWRIKSREEKKNKRQTRLKKHERRKNKKKQINDRTTIWCVLYVYLRILR